MINVGWARAGGGCLHCGRSKGLILGLLTVSIGAPYFVLSTTGPLLQALFARERFGQVPYRLFALSNLGSMPAPRWADKWLWAALAACPSILMVADTSFLTTNIAPIPNTRFSTPAKRHGGVAFTVVALLALALIRVDDDVGETRGSEVTQRNFFGTLQVFNDAEDGCRAMFHGKITHSRQYTAADKLDLPTTEIVLGDARLQLEAEPAQKLDVLVLDSFSGDSVPIHLLTREAFA